MGNVGNAVTTVAAAVLPACALLFRSVPLLLLAILAGCGSGQRDLPAADGSGAPGETVGQAVGAAVFVDGGGVRAQFSGVVLDPAGVPVPEVAVAMCASACWPARTDSSGRFVYDDLPVEQYALDVRGESIKERALTSVVFPVKLVAGVQELTAPVRLQEAVPASPWNETAAMSFSGLILIPGAGVDLAALERVDDGAASAATPPRRVVLGGAQVPASAWPAYRLARNEVAYEPVAMWALRPFGIQTGAPLGVRIPRPHAHAAAAAGTELAFFNVDLVTGAAEWLGPAVVDGAMLHTEPGRGIETLTMIILAEPRR